MDNREFAARITQVITVAAAVCAVIGILLALVARIQTPPVVFMCFCGLLAAVASYICYSFLTEYRGSGNREDDEDFFY